MSLVQSLCPGSVSVSSTRAAREGLFCTAVGPCAAGPQHACSCPWSPCAAGAPCSLTTSAVPASHPCLPLSPFLSPLPRCRHSKWPQESLLASRPVPPMGVVQLGFTWPPTTLLISSVRACLCVCTAPTDVHTRLPLSVQLLPVHGGRGNEPGDRGWPADDSAFQTAPGAPAFFPLPGREGLSRAF